MKTGAAETSKLARKSARVGDAELTPQEAERRRKQRELQAYALKLKTEGLAYKPQKHKRKVLKEPTSTAGQPKTASKKSGKSKSKHDTPTWRPYNTTCQVVILPIYWNMRHAEKEAVMAAAAKVEELLREAGITTHTDTANQYTPGQKMKYWETAGVRVRVELGPKDALQGTAVVALSGTPGTVARKKSVNVTVQLVQAVKALLEQPAEADPRSQKPLDGGGGDDLADDFEIDAEFLAAPEEEVLTLSKVQRMKHAKKQAKDRCAEV
ncbi:HGTP_anticodon domain-containing protein [Haematococcus lacustris]|uniref:HGTP_anticodon domain-containing protein n=1 Tax=Haematococcus lacustris TaxID=44745 RepID=A0A6A0AEY2_HAELA|nr:HGTP_anticodon domain-containing protein [Haematococcus lacustris]